MIGRRTTPPVVEETKLRGFDDFDLRLGDVMRGERATMGKSLLDVQRDLKIKANYIAAIENADPAAFETQGFIAGYVRSYARYLGLDPEWAYSRFCDEGDFATAHGMSPAASASRVPGMEKAPRPLGDPFSDPGKVFIPKGASVWSHIEPGAIGSVLVLVMLFGVIGYGGWSVFKEVQKVQFAPVDEAPGVTSTVGALDPNVSIAGLIEENADYPTPTADALDRLYRPEALEVPVLVARDGPISTLDPAEVGTLANLDPRGDVPTFTTPPPAASPAGEAMQEALVQVVAKDVPEVVLFAVRPSWVRVRAADGTVIFEKILDAGEQFVLPKTEEPPLLRAGNAGSVYFAVNGQNYGPAGNGPAVVKNVTLSPTALTENYAAADLSKDVDLARFVALAEASDTSPSQ